MFELPTNFSWLPPWSPLDDPQDVVGLAEELRREISAGHLLFDCQFVAIGYSERYDDFLFVTDCVDRPIAVAHLTWKKETVPTWPFAIVYPNLDGWVSAMAADNVEYVREQNGNA